MMDPMLRQELTEAVLMIATALGDITEALLEDEAESPETEDPED